MLPLQAFKKEMKPLKEIYTKEIIEFSKNYDVLCGMTIKEIPDIDIQEYAYSFKHTKGTSREELKRIHLEIRQHMDEFSKLKGISKFNQFVVSGYN